MKRHVLTLCTFALVFGLFSSTFAQDAKADDKKVDNRIWSMQYWKKAAVDGLVQVAPSAPVAPARYTGSELSALTVAIDDGPDVLIIGGTNTTQSETSVFVNPLDPNKVLNSNNSTDNPVTQVFGASGFTSSDGGATWTGSVQGTGGPNGGDPAVAVNLQGRFHNGYIADNGGNGAAWSSDEGQTWVDVQVAPNPGQLADKNHLWVDNGPTSQYEGHVYAAYTDFGGGNDRNVVIHTSTDGGLTWSAGQNISSSLPGFHQGVHIQTNSSGVVFAFYTVYLTGGVQDEPAIGMTRSFDGGTTWDTPQIIFQDTRGIRSSGTSKNMRVNSFPVSAIDISGGANDGNIYIVWSNIGEPPSNAGPDINVLMRKSTDGGDTWSSHVRVNQDDPADGNENYLPWITCDPETGALSVVFYS
ncbi:MAG: sialidase family protein, partial [Calditrichota bacterium]